MYLKMLASQLLALSALVSLVAATPLGNLVSRTSLPKPKVFLIDLFGPEGSAWYNIPEFNLLAKNITIPGLSPLFPDIHCTANYDVCQIIAGESEVNAASSLSALVFSGKFDLTESYFFTAGIAGINPKVATIGSATFARYAVQVALQYEIDAREKPKKFTTGYIPLGAQSPTTYPKDIYGTEVFELNANLRDIAVGFAKTAKLNDSDVAIKYRANYASNPAYKAGSSPPSVVACDVATSDNYYSGKLLGEAFENTTKLFTNGTGLYCTTAQEENATLEVLLRGALAHLVDFGRIIVMRTAADFDRQHDGQTAFDNLFASQGAFLPSLQNIYLAGIKVVEGILHEWDSKFCKGIKPNNYLGDIFGTLGGKPDFGPSGGFGSSNPLRKRWT